ncbi:MAG: hydroxymethylglutaryl-CoA reductase [Patescibacteria group bacterium]
MNLRAYKTVADRRKALEKEVGVDLKNISSFTLNEEVASSRNCENMIGAVQVPLGIAGPLVVRQCVSASVQEYYIPLATTEGALVASVNRGCKAITESGGAAVDSHRVGATRGPVFKVNNLAESRKLYEFLDVHFNALAAAAERTSHHLTLTNVSSRGVGRYRYVRFVYDTHDAMGLNMVTIATDAAARLIEKETGAQCIALSGNFCVDKKPSWQNFINNRGMKVWAEVTLPASVLRDVLNSTAREVHEVWIAKCMIGSAMSGSMGCNAQYANVIAAMFLATGQDPAHVSECSVGITTCEVMNEHDLYVSVYLPDLMVGTVGGGTGLATQKEALSLLGVAGGTPAGEKGKNSQRFAEIVGAAVLAGEISLLASLEEGTLAKAHERLARGKG